jgi:hypothetical protein
MAARGGNSDVLFVFGCCNERLSRGGPVLESNVLPFQGLECIAGGLAPHDETISVGRIYNIVTTSNPVAFGLS